MTDPRSPFLWSTNRTPSIFVQDIRFTGAKRSGKTLNETASESVEMMTKRDGRNPGTVRGISAKANLQLEEFEQKRRRAR